jgi:hypothetical protein
MYYVVYDNMTLTLNHYFARVCVLYTIHLFLLYYMLLVKLGVNFLTQLSGR